MDVKITAADLERGKGWKEVLGGELGAEYQVIVPQMPNKQNAKYREWEIWFEKHTPFINDDVVFVGHSLGGSFLAKYLAVNRFPKRIAGTILIAAPYERGRHMLGDFTPPESLALFSKQGGTILLYHSSDDPVVPFSELAKYQAALPHARVRIFSNRQHFNQESFPELVADIRSLAP